jgi:hypothetical protein
VGVGGSHNNGGPEICVEVCDRLANGGRIEKSEDFHEPRDPQHSARARARVRECVFVCASERECVCDSVRVCGRQRECVCVRERESVWVGECVCERERE